MASPVALIQGASRGLGLHFCQHLLRKYPTVNVVATARNPDASPGLKSLMLDHPQRVTLVQLDACNEESIAEAVSVVSQAYEGIDLIVNTAAILHPTGRGETSLKEVNLKDLHLTLATNAFGPLLTAKHFKPLLLKGNGYFGGVSVDSKEKHRSIIASISAKVGSIGDNGLGGWYGYRMSKTALNMAMKNLSIELGRGKNKVICASLHPGTVDTDLSRPYHKNVPKDKLFTADHSVNCLMDIVQKLTVKDSGRFFNWDGSHLPY